MLGWAGRISRNLPSISHVPWLVWLWMDFFSSFPSCVLSPTEINIMKRYLACPHTFIFLPGKGLFFFDHASDPVRTRSVHRKIRLSPVPSPWVLAHVYLDELKTKSSIFTSHNTRTQNTYSPNPVYQEHPPSEYLQSTLRSCGTLRQNVSSITQIRTSFVMQVIKRWTYKLKYN